MISNSTPSHRTSVQAYWNAKASPRFSPLDRLPSRASVQELALARRAVDDELSALHMVMCAMRTRRNHLSLIGRLPSEILSFIFSFHAVNQPVARDPIYNSDDPFPPSLTQVELGWITVTHVCRHWRQVAISNPNLWCTIVFDLGAKWAEEMLARSKSALITYSRDLSFRPRIPRTILDDEATLRTHLPHIQRLVLDGTSDTLAPAVRALTTPAPHLESVELRGSAHHIRAFCVTLPSNLFAHHAPNLRRVTFVDCALSWSSSFFRDLTHLEIRIPAAISSSSQPAEPTTLHINGPAVPSLDQFISILDRMPSLQVLTLGNCLPHPDSTSRFFVPLRHMSRLTLEGSVSESVNVLEHISIPGSASLSLRCPTHDATPGVLNDLLSLISTHFRAPETLSLPLSTIFISTTDYPPYLSITAWDTDASSHLPEFTPPVLSRLQLSFSCRREALLQSLPLQVCKMLPLNDLRTFSITRSSVDWTPAEWADLSDHSPKVTHVRACHGCAPALARTLAECTVFPQLATLSLQDVDFTALLSSDSDSYSLPLHVHLPVWLRARRNAGIPVRRVEIRSCTVEQAWVESLRDVVHCVKWDGDRGGHVDSDSDSELRSSSLGSDTRW